jgi:hypothetical protein
MRGMTVLDRVRDLLSRIAPRAACDDCIADELKLTVRQHANRKTTELEKDKRYDRRIGDCSFCKASNKKVIGYA